VRRVRHAACAGLAAAFLAATLVLGEVTVVSREQLRELHFGWPVPFVAQDLTRFDPPLPYRMSMCLSPWECPARLRVWPALASFGLAFAAIEALAGLAARSLARRHEPARPDQP
jgi:hypothetical protein